MIKTLIFLILSITLQVNATEIDNSTLRYFEKIAFGSEFKSQGAFLQKWSKPMKIFVNNKAPHYLKKELEQIVAELNPLIKPMRIEIVSKIKKSNFTINFSSFPEYAKVEPSAKEFSSNWGLFWVYSDKNKNIYKGSMYVDIVRCKSKEAQKHLLREELTQALGLMKDSNRYRDSIFYGKWKPHTTEYSELDKKIIKLLYNPKIKAGMSLESFRIKFPR